MPIPQDNTRVVIREYILPKQMTDQDYLRYMGKEYRKQSKEETVTDADRAEYYRNKQNFYNTNAFGYGMQGNQTNFDPTTPEGQAAIDAAYNYAKGNAMETLGMGTTGGSIGKAVSAAKAARSPFKRGVEYLGDVSQYVDREIGRGAQSIVIDNTPGTVAKFSSIPPEEMALMNKLPAVAKSKHIGYVTDEWGELPVYVQKRMKIVSEEDFPRYLEMLDKPMRKAGFKPVQGLDGKSYTNRRIVIDDINPGNVAVDRLGRPRLIDFSRVPYREWLEFAFKSGGKLSKRKYKIK